MMYTNNIQKERRVTMETYIPSLQENNTITLKIDTSCSMAEVYVNGTIIMRGNYWDFYNGCHGMYDIPSFNSYSELIAIIKNYISSQNKQYTLVREEYQYE